MDDQPAFIIRLVMIGLDVITAGIGEITVPEANRTEVIGHVGAETAILAHTICAFVLVALSIFFVIDTFFFPYKMCRCRPHDLLDFIISVFAMLCGIAYIITIMVGKSDYFPVIFASGLFSVFRATRNIIKAVRVGYFITNQAKKINVVAPEPPQKETQKETQKESMIIPKQPQETQQRVAAQNMELFWTGNFRAQEVSEDKLPTGPKTKPKTKPSCSPHGPKELPALVMTEINAEVPNFVKSRRLSSLLHPGEVLDDSYLISNLRRFQEKLTTWDFDVFEFARETKDSPLVTVTYVALNGRDNVYNNFDISSKTFLSFLHNIEEGYMDNAYHNSRHAADITQAMTFLCFHGGLHEIMQLTPVEVLSLIIACACHDLAHPGVSNKFLTVTSDEMAIRYNDLHVLEQFSCSLALGLLSKPENNFLADKPMSTRKEFRKLFIDTVLATDLAGHAQFTKQFGAHLNGDGFDFSNPKHRSLVLKLMIKAVDISHPCRTFALHNRFTMLLEEELIKQTEQETKAGIPVSIVANRGAAAIAKSQIGFMAYMIKPFFTDVSKFLVSRGNTFAADVLIPNIDSNLAEWRRIQESHDA